MAQSFIMEVEIWEEIFVSDCSKLAIGVLFVFVELFSTSIGLISTDFLWGFSMIFL